MTEQELIPLLPPEMQAQALLRGIEELGFPLVTMIKIHTRYTMC